MCIAKVVSLIEDRVIMTTPSGVRIAEESDWCDRFFAADSSAKVLLFSDTAMFGAGY